MMNVFVKETQMMKTKFRKFNSRSRLSLYDPISDDFFLTSRFTCSEGRKHEKKEKKIGCSKWKMTHQQKWKK